MARAAFRHYSQESPLRGAILGALHGAIERGASSDELRATLNELLELKAVDAPGYQALLRRARTLDLKNNAEPLTDAGRDK